MGLILKLHGGDRWRYALAYAVAFATWGAVRRLLERGAKATIWQAAALGLMDRVEEHCEAALATDLVTNAFWFGDLPLAAVDCGAVFAELRCESELGWSRATGVLLQQNALSPLPKSEAEASLGLKSTP